ncbi:MAG: PH domain-containing protein [Thermoanaerobaculia bacterium]
MPTETFPIVPSGARTFWFVAVLLVLILIPVLVAVAKVPLVAPALLIVVGVGAIVGYSAASSRRALFELSPEGLRIRHSMFGKRVPREEIVLSEARAIDLTQETGYKPFLRLWGAGLLGYSEGWFLLRNHERALGFLTDRTRVAYLPTAKGYKVMLSIEDPRAFLDAARRVWGG